MTVRSVEKAIKVLLTFTTEHRLQGVSEISDKLGMNQSSVHHIAHSLQEWGLLERDPLTRKYRLGIRLVELAGTMLQSRNLAQTTQTYLHHIADTVEETAYLGVLIDGDLLNIAQVCGPHLIQYAGWQGRRTPFYCTSGGKVLVAYLPVEESETILDTRVLQQLTSKTITDPTLLRQELETVREQGYAVSFGEMDESINAVAVPIKGLSTGNTQVVAALAVAGPSYRFTEQACVESIGFLQSVAQEVAGKLNLGDFKQSLISDPNHPLATYSKEHTLEEMS